jgi:CheY-like chemotaxis protein
MPPGNVLVVEDDDALRLLLIEYLKEHSQVQADGARDGADALHRITMRRYSVVILDVMMPFMTGIDFLDSLQALASDPSVRALEYVPAVIVVTSASPEHVPSRHLEERFPSMVRAVLRKPLQPEQLELCLRRWLE